MIKKALRVLLLTKVALGVVLLLIYLFYRTLQKTSPSFDPDKPLVEYARLRFGVKNLTQELDSTCINKRSWSKITF